MSSKEDLTEVKKSGDHGAKIVSEVLLQHYLIFLMAYALSYLENEFVHTVHIRHHIFACTVQIHVNL